MYSPHRWYTNLVRPGLGTWQSAPLRGPRIERLSWARLLWGCPLSGPWGVAPFQAGAGAQQQQRAGPRRIQGEWLHICEPSHRQLKSPPAATWMGLEMITLKWAKSDREGQTPCNITYMWGPPKWYKWTYLQSRNRLTDLENKFTVTRGEIS